LRGQRPSAIFTRSMAKRFAVILILLLLAIIAVAIYWNVSGRPVPIEVTRLGESSLRSTVNTNGKVEAENVYDLRAPVSGVCQTVLAREGETVKKGQPLLLLENPALPSDIAGARAEIDAAEAELRTVRRGAPSEEVNQAEAEVSRLALQLESAQKTLQTNEWLLQKNAIPKSELDQSRREVDQLQQVLRAARTRLTDIKSRYTEQDRRRGESRVKAARTRLEFLEKNQAASTVRAPEAGTLYRFTLRPGSYLNAGEPVGLIADLSRLRLRVYVDEPDLGQVHPGAEIAIRWSAYPVLSWKGTVKEIPPEVVRLETRSVAEVLCSIDSPRSVLIPNVNVDVAIATRPGPKVSSLPRGAVFTDGVSQYVWLAQDGQAVRRTVQTGQSTTSIIEIKAGISQSDTVIVPGDTPITEGMRIEVPRE
jgi:multidrug resistance efflux pump